VVNFDYHFVIRFCSVLFFFILTLALPYTANKE